MLLRSSFFNSTSAHRDSHHWAVCRGNHSVRHRLTLDQRTVGGTSVVWVRVPIEPRTDLDHVWMYYANPTAPDLQQPHGTMRLGEERSHSAFVPALALWFSHSIAELLRTEVRVVA